MKNLKPHQMALLLAGILSITAWALPSISQFLLPLTYLNTLFHEMCHAIAGQLTGANIEMVRVNGDGSGVTPMSGGSIWLIGPAGYVGSAMIGAAIIWFSRTEEGARNTLRFAAVGLALGMLLWLRGDFIGVIAGIGWTTLLFLGSVGLRGLGLIFAAQFIGLQQCLNSIQALYTLLNISAASEAQSDALIMQNHTHIPAFVWALGWCAFSLVLVVLSLRRAWSASPASRVAQPSPGR